MRTITFYSYKGGVGRSLALANIASRLTEFERRVCLLDFDLEAPGLHYKFAAQLADRGLEVKNGLVDYIHHFATTGDIADRITDFSLSYLNPPKTFTSLIPAGNINEPEYWKKLSAINWDQLLYQNEAGLYFFLDLKQKIKRELAPDYLLIDSRTGITEMSGISLSLLADDAVVFAANNRENIEGAKRIIRTITDPNNQIIKKIPKITFVLSRVPFNDQRPEDKEKEAQLVDQIKKEMEGLIDDIYILHSDRELEENEKIKIGYEKEDGTGVSGISRDYIRLFEAITEGELKPEEVERFNLIKESERSYRQALKEPSIDLKIKLLDIAIDKLAGSGISNNEFILYRLSLYEKLGNWEKVIQNCDLALTTDSGNLIFLEKKAWAKLKLYENGEAKNLFERIMISNKSRVTAKLGYAEILLREKNYIGAKDMFSEVIEIKVEVPAGLTGKAKAELHLGEKEQALRDIYQALALNSDYAEAFVVLAEINAAKENWDEFYLNFEKALKLSSEISITAILENSLYFMLSKENRFQAMLEKYNVHIENISETEN